MMRFVSLGDKCQFVVPCIHDASTTTIVSISLHFAWSAKKFINAWNDAVVAFTFRCLGSRKQTPFLSISGSIPMINFSMLRMANHRFWLHQLGRRWYFLHWMALRCFRHFRPYCRKVLLRWRTYLTRLADCCFCQGTL